MRSSCFHLFLKSDLQGRRTSLTKLKKSMGSEEKISVRDWNVSVCSPAREKWQCAFDLFFLIKDLIFFETICPPSVISKSGAYSSSFSIADKTLSIHEMKLTPFRLEVVSVSATTEGSAAKLFKRSPSPFTEGICPAIIILFLL